MTQKNSIFFFLMVFIIGILNFFIVYFQHYQAKSLKHYYPREHHFALKYDFEELSKLLGKAEGSAQAKFIDNHLIIELDGYRRFQANDLSNVLNGDLHVYEQLGLYSLNYIAQIAKEYKANINKTQANIIIRSLTETLDHIDRFTFVPTRMMFNDHVVSARIESLLLSKSFLQEHGYLEAKLNSKIDRHIHYCVIDLLDDKKFTWRTNHGLMQLRALLSFDFATQENRHSEEVRKKITSILEGNILLDFHISDDGSIFESATGYWAYVYSQWATIASFPIMQNNQTMQERLEKTRYFLDAVRTNDGFMQGIGDSYSFFRKNQPSGKIENGNHIFRFSNGLAGLNILDKSHNNLHLLFVSLDNKPHVKKHPEDLSLYIYWKQPFFINPGTFAYDSSPERKHVRSQAVQNTFFDPEHDMPDSSAVFMDFFDNTIFFRGMKHYSNDVLKREVNVCFQRGLIKIIDSGKKTNLKSGFNIHPSVKVDILDPFTIKLVGELSTILIQSNVSPQLNIVKVSDAMNSMTEVKRVEYSGDTIILELTLSNYLSPENTLTKIMDNDKTYQRMHAAEQLSRKYWWSDFIQIFSLKRLIIPRVLIVIIFSSLLVFTKSKNMRQYFIVGYSGIALLDILIYGALFSRYFMWIYDK